MINESRPGRDRTETDSDIPGQTGALCRAGLTPGIVVVISTAHLEAVPGSPTARHAEGLFSTMLSGLALQAVQRSQVGHAITLRMTADEGRFQSYASFEM